MPKESLIKKCKRKKLLNTLVSIELLQTAIQGRDDVTYTVNCHIYDLNKDEKEDKEKYFSKKIYNNDTTIDLTI